MSNPNILSPIRAGSLQLANRAWMAPLTRCRANAGFVPHELNATYYAQRAGAGLIISEATQISQEGQGYPNTPGIYSPEQVEGWKLVTDAVHRAGGKIICQLWHVGRVSHNAYQAGGAPPVAPSAIAAKGMCRLPDGSREPYPVPRALETDEIERIVREYETAAANAKKAGFDGVQLHAANTYLLEQFLRDSSNTRTDQYGGSIQNRAAFLLEAAEALVAVWGPDRVGVRLSPSGWSAEFTDSTPLETYLYVAEELDKLELAFLEIREADADSIAAGSPNIPVAKFRAAFSGALIANTGYSRERADQGIAKDDFDAVTFGKPFISNPDLVERFRLEAPLTPWDAKTFYPGPGVEFSRGYTDYPALAS
ncbi:MAG: alkene reductase [Phycisphaeraceae bacterium]|nr:alkene reductase [Phycisphaeraceae bacterium]